MVVASGPFETFSWTLAPLRDWPPLGLCATTVPTGWSDGTWTMVGLKPLAARSRWATSDVWPTSLGTLAVALPLETLIRTDVPRAIVSPAAGACATTVPTGWPELTETLLTLKPAATSRSRASAWATPTAFGTFTDVGGAATVSTTREPLAALLPPAGCSPTTVPGRRTLTRRMICVLKPSCCRRVTAVVEV